MGIYGVGKTTLINNFKKMFESENLVKWNYKNIQSVQDDFEKNIEKVKSSDKNLLVSIEIDINLFEFVIEKIKNYSVFVINIIPKNKENYKNNLINKFFYSNKNKSNEFYNNIIEMLYDSKSDSKTNPEINLFIDNFNNLKNKIDPNNFYLLDKDFNFINLIIDKLILFSHKKIANVYNLQINQIQI
jgi:thymidylate kinase